MDNIYASITYATLTGARDRVLDDLNQLTDGNAERAIKYVNEFLELDKILSEHESKQPKAPYIVE